MSNLSDEQLDELILMGQLAEDTEYEEVSKSSEQT